MFLALGACSNMQDKIKKMLDTHFVFTESKMYLWKPVTSLACYPYANAKYKLVVYADSSECTQCYLTHLEHWEKYVNIEKQSKGKFVCLFVIEGKRTNIPTVSEMIRLKHTIYFDEYFTLRHENPQIPRENVFHVFLVDKNDKIKLVGNPIQNEKIELLLDSILTKDVLYV